MHSRDAERHDLVRDFHEAMLAHAEQADIRLADDHWTLKEMVGHLIDSASNNHQRFVRLQIEERLAFPAYDQERFRAVSRVADMDYGLLVELWRLYNEFLLELVARADPAAMGHVWQAPDGDTSLEFLIEDYFTHLRWHFDLFAARAVEIGRAGEATPA